MLSYLPILLLVVAMIALAARNRRRAAEQQRSQQECLTFGTEVMTTSGLYGTIVGRNEDGSVQLAIAPGVVVKWAAAALRDVQTLPAQYRRDEADNDAENDSGRDSGPETDPGN